MSSWNQSGRISYSRYKRDRIWIKILINSVLCDLPVGCKFLLCQPDSSLQCDIHALLSKSLWLYCLESGWTWGLPWALKGSGIDADDIWAEAWRDMKLLPPLSLSWTVMWDSLNQSLGETRWRRRAKSHSKVSARHWGRLFGTSYSPGLFPDLSNGH